MWKVEALFRSAKSLLGTRPIYHQCDETIRGHVFCSFLALALVLRKALQDRLQSAGLALEWNDILRDLEALEEVEVLHEGKRFSLRSQTQGCCAQVFQAVGVRIPQTVRQLN